jgi:hypothetical protein
MGDSGRKKKLVWLIVTLFHAKRAQVFKQQRGFRMVRVEHRMLWGNAEEYRSRLKANGLSGNINTSFVERANLTIRQSVSKLTRRTLGPAKLGGSSVLVAGLLSFRSSA